MEQKTSSENLLIERIVQDARSEADAAMAEATANCQRAREDCDARILELTRAFERDREQQVAGVLDGAKTRAALDGRKEALRDKRRVLDEVFTSARQALHELSGEKREKLLRALLVREAEAGCVIVPAFADREALTRLSKELEQPLPVSDTDAKSDGGFILSGESYEKDCSFDALMDEIRQAEETNVSRILFG